MSRINMGRVILGGLLAGLVINISEFILNMVVVGKQMEEAVAKLGLPPVGGAAIGMFTVLCFVLGIVMIWLYAAIRPRYGAGPATAVRAGVAVYFLSYVYPSLGTLAMGMFPGQLISIGLVWGFVEVMIAAVAGAWVYKEAPAA
ncbi:MAG: hypothetical protein A3H96_08365 [Acidobacteria bacterium RIFCSPLOWO2_02_FULL_67_36]|nr:MAG: hypothetical protein A3H96_08365 [Acidobacteria bacterium RIFCSPLOWO2_02_FULL_67_36]OFW22271.1 MAG: hypothetical protein A3G21_01645 [Acidobacteria bacterium RIFCSPLOWO2_12_FULL_66_21]